MYNNNLDIEERMTGSHEVSGSIPLCSTIFYRFFGSGFFVFSENVCGIKNANI